MVAEWVRAWEWAGGTNQPTPELPYIREHSAAWCGCGALVGIGSTAECRCDELERGCSKSCPSCGKVILEDACLCQYARLIDPRWLVGSPEHQEAVCSETERRYPKISRPVVVVAGPLARRVSRQKAEKAFWQFAERHFERGTLLIASEKGFRGRFRFHAWLRGVDPASGEVRAVKPDARIVGQRITRVAHREENVALVLDAHRAGIPAWVVHRLRGVPTLTHVEDLLARELRISLREAERLLEQGDSAIGEIFQISRSSRKRQKPSLSTAQRPITGKRGSR